MKKKSRWSKNDEDFLVEKYNHLRVTDIANELCKTERSVRMKAFRLSLRRDNLALDKHTTMPPKMIGEEWKDVVGYEGIYLVSSLGRIWSLGIDNRHPKILKTYILPNGYVTVNLYDKNRKMKTNYIHRLVATSFIENPNNFKDVNHKDEVRSNNKVSNLEWCNRSYNNNYGTRNLKVSRPVKMISLDGRVLNYFIGLKEASRKTGIPSPNIRKCCKIKYAKKNNCIGYPYLTAGGFRWEYATKEECDNMFNEIKNRIKNE